MISIGQLTVVFAAMIAFVAMMSTSDRDKAPRRNPIKLKDLPTGTYEIHAVRLHSGERPQPVIGTLEVISAA